jgi:hypothetical protein
MDGLAEDRILEVLAVNMGGFAMVGWAIPGYVDASAKVVRVRSLRHQQDHCLEQTRCTGQTNGVARAREGCGDTEHNP